MRKMGKLGKMILRLTLGISLMAGTFAGTSQSVFAEEGYTEKDIPVYRKSLSGNEKMRCYYFDDMPNVPYVSYETFLKQFYKIDLKVTSSGSGVFNLSRKAEDKKTYTAVLNTNKETLTVQNTSGFFEINEETEESGSERSEAAPFMKKEFTEKKSGTLKQKVYNFKKNGIDLKNLDDQPMMPLASLSDLYGNEVGSIVIYNGEKIYFDGESTVLNSGKARSDDYGLIQPLIDGTRSADMAEFAYKELCFAIENVYGYPNTTYPFAKKMKASGLDAALTELDPQTKKLLTSRNSENYIFGLNRLLMYWLNDGGHTGITFEEMEIVTTGGSKNKNLKKNKKFVNDIGEGSWPGGKGTLNTDTNPNLINCKRHEKAEAQKLSLSALRGEAYGTEEESGLKIKGDTAIIFFDGFELDEQGWKAYYKAVDAGKKGTVPKDTYGLVATSLQKISQNKNIRNIVLDLSLNGGGVDIAMWGVEDLLFGKNEHVVKFQSNGITYKSTKVFDRNLDGKFDAKDKKVDFSKYNISVMTSEVSFSCGNALPAYAKQQNYMIMGANSGGGSCTVSLHSTADGFTYQISAQLMIINPAAIGGNVDKGVKVDRLTIPSPEQQKKALREGTMEDYLNMMKSIYKPEEMSYIIRDYYGDYSNEWMRGRWYTKNGSKTYKYKGSWKKNSKGSWFGDTSGWYAKKQWQKIDGDWYYFDSKGYMVTNAWVKGYWIGANGKQTYSAKGSWKNTDRGWMFKDTSGWYAKAATVTIDGKKYKFDENGIYVK